MLVSVSLAVRISVAISFQAPSITRPQLRPSNCFSASRVFPLTRIRRWSYSQGISVPNSHCRLVCPNSDYFLASEREYSSTNMQSDENLIILSENTISLLETKITASEKKLRDLIEMIERGNHSVDTISKLQIEADRWLALLKEKVSVEEIINAILQRPNQFKSNYGGVLIHLKPAL
jgi:hypothetical protein